MWERSLAHLHGHPSVLLDEGIVVLVELQRHGALPALLGHDDVVLVLVLVLVVVLLLLGTIILARVLVAAIVAAFPPSLTVVAGHRSLLLLRCDLALRGLVRLGGRRGSFLLVVTKEVFLVAIVLSRLLGALLRLGGRIRRRGRNGVVVVVVAVHHHALLHPDSRWRRRPASGASAVAPSATTPRAAGGNPAEHLCFRDLTLFRPFPSVCFHPGSSGSGRHEQPTTRAEKLR